LSGFVVGFFVCLGGGFCFFFSFLNSLPPAAQSLFPHLPLHLEHNLSPDLFVLSDTPVTALLQNFLEEGTSVYLPF